MARPTQVAGLSRETPMSDAVRAFAAARLADARKFVLLVRRERGVEGVHDLRVSLRRLRAVLTLGAGALKRAEREAKRLQDALGEVRDLQLHVAWISPQPGHGSGKAARKGSGKASGKLANGPAGRAAGGAARGAATADPGGVLAELLVDRLQRLEGREEKLEDALRRWADEEPSLLGALAGLELKGKLGGHRQRTRLRRRLREVQERMHAARGSLEAKVAHALRIAVKKLRYDAELAEPALPAAAAAILHELVPLQETLGDLHDCDVRLELLARAAKKRGEDALSGRLRVQEIARRGQLAQRLAQELSRFRDQSVPRKLRAGLR